MSSAESPSPNWETSWNIDERFYDLMVDRPIIVNDNNSLSVCFTEQDRKIARFVDGTRVSADRWRIELLPIGT